MWAHCWRGSLEDVLKEDDIKLDWTFRLSLLTDLVKGMRYLHASPLRVHGRLTSRACAVDSRWVLRVSDYGQPALSRAQPGPAPPPAARGPHSTLHASAARPRTACSLPAPASARPRTHSPPLRLQSCCGPRRSCCAM